MKRFESRRANATIAPTATAITTFRSSVRCAGSSNRCHRELDSVRDHLVVTVRSSLRLLEPKRLRLDLERV